MSDAGFIVNDASRFRSWTYREKALVSLDCERKHRATFAGPKGRGKSAGWHARTGHAILILGVISQIVQDGCVVRMRPVGSGNRWESGIGSKVVVDNAGTGRHRA